MKGYSLRPGQRSCQKLKSALEAVKNKLHAVYTKCSILIVNFEWDEKKNKANRSKHGIRFEEAKEIFSGPVFTAEDCRRDYGESRFISIGTIQGIVVLVVAYIFRNGKVRLISARKANEKERSLYYGYLKAALK